MLETPSIRRYSCMVTPSFKSASMRSENPTGADNQQETARSTLELDPNWVVGFVDGEGCFSVSVHRNLKRAAYRWLAAASRLPRPPTPGSSRSARRARHVLRFRPASAQGTQSSVLTYAVD